MTKGKEKERYYADKLRSGGLSEKEIEAKLRVWKKLGILSVVKKPKKHKNLVISERAVNYLFGQLKIKGVRRYGAFGQQLDYKLMWVVDFLSSEISRRAGFSKNKKGELALFKNASQFFNFTKKLNQFESVLFEFKASEVREWLGFSSDKMSIRDIVDLFRALQGVIFEAESEPILRDVEKGKWVKTTVVSSSLYSMKRKELKKVISNRWNTKDIYLTLRFDSVMGWLFLANLSCGQVGRMTLPQKAIHELSGYEQNILREIRLWRHPRKYSIFELSRIAGLKSKVVFKLKKSLIKMLENLKNRKYIKDFKITGRGKNTKFLIVK